MRLDDFNALAFETAAIEFERCCGSQTWVRAMGAQRPFENIDSLLTEADRTWAGLAPDDWLEAFKHHPRIGDLDSLKAKYANTKQWAQGEQSGAESAPESVLHALAVGNQQYEAKFGYLFIVCATGKTASEMLEILNNRLPHDPALELGIAAEEQRKITRIRLEKLLAP